MMDVPRGSGLFRFFVQKQRQNVVRCSLGPFSVGTTGLVSSSCGTISPVFLTFPSIASNPKNSIWPIVNIKVDAVIIVKRTKGE